MKERDWLKCEWRNNKKTILKKWKRKGAYPDHVAVGCEKWKGKKKVLWGYIEKGKKRRKIRNKKEGIRQSRRE